MEKQDYINKAHVKYPYITLEDLEDCYYFAKESLLNVLYPFRVESGGEGEDNPVPKRYQYKLLEVMYEMIDMGNGRHFTSYSENGVSWKRDSSELQSLKNIIPYADYF